MKKILLATLVLISGVLTTSSIQAANSGVYIGAMGGANFLNFSEKEIYNSQIDLDINKGYLIGGIAGYNYADIPLRVEGEFSYRHNSVKNITIDGSKLSFNKEKNDASIDVFTYMYNVYYDFNLDCDFTPYIGFGIGYSIFRVNFKADDIKLRGTGDGLTSQRIAGISYALCDKTDLGLEYRHINTKDGDHAVTMNLRRYF